MGSPDPSHDSFAPDPCDEWDPYDDLSQQQTQMNELKLCQLLDWDSDRTYDESYIRYSIDWKVTVNNRAVVPKDTEQGVVLESAAYWQQFLKPKLEASIRKINRSLKSDFTSVVVSVTQRKEPDLTKRFNNTTIDWTVIENQLVAWGDFYREGKKLRLNLSFNFVDTTNTSLRRGDKRGSSLTTLRMLTEGAAQVDAEQHSSGQPSIWRAVYSLMRCTGPPCDKGPHCWRDSVGKKHFKLYTHHMTDLVTYVQDGNTLQTHDDVPENIRQQLYDEEKKSLERHKKTTTTSVASLPPINITNVLPAPMAPGMPSNSSTIDRLNIAGFRDVVVKEYCAWQQSQVDSTTLKVEYQKACEVILEEGMDLETIRRKPNPDFLTKKGVKRGIAEHVVDDIDYWVEKYKRARTEE